MAAPAGFYPNPDPAHPELERFWDGTRWTPTTRPLVPASAEQWQPDGPAEDVFTQETLPVAPLQPVNPASRMSPILQKHGWPEESAPSAATGVGGLATVLSMFSGGSSSGLSGLSSSGVLISPPSFGRRGGRMTILNLVFVALISAAFFAAGLFMLKMANPEMSKPTDVVAEVVSVSRSISSKSDTCTPTFLYTASNGQTYTTTANYASSSMCGLREGQEITITYDANNPTLIGGFDSGGNWFTWLFLILPFVVMAGAVFSYIRGRRAI